MKPTRTLGIIAVILVAVAILLLVLRTSDQGEDTVKIGVLYPVSGPAASWGLPARDGVILAANYWNGLGGIDGKKIELVIEDSKCNPQEGVTAMNKLVHVDGVRYVIGDICSAVVVPTAPVAEENDVIVLAQGSSPEITPLKVFRNWPSDARQGRIIATYAYEVLGFRSVAVIGVNNPYGNGLSETFSDVFSELGGEIPLKESYEQEERDFRTVLLKVKELEVDALYLAPQVEGPFIAKQARELGIDVPFISADTVGDPEAVEAAEGAFEGTVFAYPFFNETNSDVVMFKEMFVREFAREPESLLVAAHGFDAMNIMAMAIEGSSTPEEVREAMAATSHEGISGDTAFDKNGDVTKPYGVYILSEGEPELLSVQ